MPPTVDWSSVAGASCQGAWWSDTRNPVVFPAVMVPPMPIPRVPFWLRSTSTVVLLRQPENSRQIRAMPVIGSVFWVSFEGVVVAWEVERAAPAAHRAGRRT
jgi:hypothetical protein